MSDSVNFGVVVFQAPLFMGISRQEYWEGLPFPPPSDLPDPGMEPASLTPLALEDRLFTTNATWEIHGIIIPISLNC